jgi:hypothetical protein
LRSRRIAAFALVVGPVVIAACADDPVSGPAVSVMKLAISPAAANQACYAVMTTSGPSQGLGITDLCPDAAAADLIAGIDQLRLIIDYGDVGFAGSQGAPVPTVLVTADGKPLDGGVSVLPESRVFGHTYFVATLTAPSVITSNLQFTVTVNPGYQTIVPTIWSVRQPVNAISVLTRSPLGCAVLVTGERPDAALGLPDPCTGGAALGVLDAGTDVATVVVDDGPVDLLGKPAKIAPPAVSVVIDGRDSALPVIVSGVNRAGGHVFFLATFTTPLTLSSDVRIAVAAVPGAALVTDRLVIRPTAISLAIAECPDSPCEQQAAVGAVHLTVSIPGEVPQSITVRNVIDGIVTDDNAQTVTTVIGSGTTTRTIAMPVPAAAEGATWQLEVQLGAVPTRSDPITIRRPAIDTSLSCGASCTIAPGTQVGLTIVAPRDIRPHQAMVFTAIDGVPIVTGSALDLTDDNATGTARGVTTLVAPSTTGTWTVDVSIAGYRANTLIATVQ